MNLRFEPNYKVAVQELRISSVAGTSGINLNFSRHANGRGCFFESGDRANNWPEPRTYGRRIVCAFLVPTSVDPAGFFTFTQAIADPFKRTLPNADPFKRTLPKNELLVEFHWSKPFPARGLSGSFQLVVIYTD